MTSPCNRDKVVVIAGPTAVGKTFLGIELSGRFNGEVVNADSRYLYRGFAIGVAKPSANERRDIPHHLIDILDPHDAMSLALYQQRAHEAIRSVFDHGRLPFLVGGTPLYINAVVEGWRIPSVPPDPAFRQTMEAMIGERGLEPLVDRLRAVDPRSADRANLNPRRVIRALEIHEATGIPMSQLQGKGPRPYDTLEIGLWMPRGQLLAAIDKRVDDQIAAGLVEEVKSLLADGVDPASPAFSSLGYRQLLPFIRGEATLDEAVARIKFDTHRYVRHQETWLRKNQRLVRVDVTDDSWVERCSQLVKAFLTAKQP